MTSYDFKLAANQQRLNIVTVAPLTTRSFQLIKNFSIGEQRLRYRERYSFKANK
jgi:hypothetical protein